MSDKIRGREITIIYFDECPLVLFSAYGRKYYTEEEIIKAFESGVDFKISGGPYCSIRDFKDQKVLLGLGNGRYVEYFS